MTYRFQDRLAKTYGVSRPTPNKPPVYAAIENYELPLHKGGQGRPDMPTPKPWGKFDVGLVCLCIGMLMGAGAYHLAMVAAVYFKG